jgi:hypothetical protein
VVVLTCGPAIWQVFTSVKSAGIQASRRSLEKSGDWLWKSGFVSGNPYQVLSWGFNIGDTGESVLSHMTLERQIKVIVNALQQPGGMDSSLSVPSQPGAMTNFADYRFERRSQWRVCRGFI